MSIPAIIMLILVSLNLLIGANLHGKERKEKKHNFTYSFISALITVSLLYWGGFFN